MLLAATAGCGYGDSKLIVGATTSLDDLGIFQVLIDEFKKLSGYDVTPVVAGSGQILELGWRGEVDVAFTNSPPDESSFLAEGYGIDPRRVMRSPRATTCWLPATSGHTGDVVDLTSFVVDDVVNGYTVARVNPKLHDEVNAEVATVFLDFSASEPADAIVNSFGRDEFGVQLFYLPGVLDEPPAFPFRLQ